MGDLYHLNKEKIRQHNVKVFSSNYALYGDMSRRVMSTLAAHVRDVEIYSIDEAFLCLDGFQHHGLSNYAASIRANVKRATGIPVSIGLGPTKTLAKIVNRLAKKLPSTDGVFNLIEADIDTMLGQVYVGDVWGIGRQWATWLKGQGITTALDLKCADPKTIRARMRVVVERIVSELNGQSCFDLLSWSRRRRRGLPSRDRSAGNSPTGKRSGRPCCSSSDVQGRSCLARICRPIA
jgi:DNA polymerase V